MTADRDPGSHDAVTGATLPGDDDAGQAELGRWLSGSVPPLDAYDRAALFAHTFDPATPDPPAHLIPDPDVFAPGPFPVDDGYVPETVHGADVHHELPPWHGVSPEEFHAEESHGFDGNDEAGRDLAGPADIDHQDLPVHQGDDGNYHVDHHGGGA